MPLLPRAVADTMASVGAGARREKLQTIKEREDLKDALVAKFRERVSRSTPRVGTASSSGNTERIRREVDNLVSTAPVTEANLVRLDRRIQRQVRGRPDGDAASVGTVSSYSKGSRRPSAPQSARGPSTANSQRLQDSGPLSARAMGDAGYAQSPSNCAKPLNWASIDKLAAKMHAEDAERHRSKQQELQSKLRDDLDKQVIDGRRKGNREKEDDIRFHEQQQRQLGQWQEAEKARGAKARETAMVEAGERDMQLVDLARRREEERARESREAEAMQQRLAVENEADRRRAEDRKQQLREHAEKANAENAAAIQRRQEAMSQRENDAPPVALLADSGVQPSPQKRFRDKAEAENKRLDKIAAERLAAQKQSEEEFVARAQADRTAKDQRDLAQEISKSERLQRDRLANQAFLFKQMQEKQDRHKADAQKKRERGVVLENDAQTFGEEEKIRAAETRGRSMDHRSEVEKQMSLKANVAPQRDVMSNLEARMNRAVLEKVGVHLDDTGSVVQIAG